MRLDFLHRPGSGRAGRTGSRGVGQHGVLRAAAIALAAAVVLAPALAGSLGDRADAATGTGGLTLIFLNPQKAALSLPGVQVALTEEGTSGTTAAAVSDATGRATFSALPGGTWDAVITPPQAGSATRVPVRLAGIEVTAGQVAYRAVVLRIGASIGGTLRNAYGAELANVAVVIRVGATPDIVGRAVTDLHGHFWFRGVATGAYSVQYNPPQGNPRPHEATEETWSFWGQQPGTAYTSGVVHAVNATAGNVQSVIDGTDGVVLEGTFLKTNVDPQGTTDFSHATLTYAGDGIGSTFTFPVFGAGIRGAYGFARVVPGRYRVSVTGTTATGTPVTYYYTGETTAPSRSPSAAVWVPFTDGAVVTFPRTP